MAINNQLAGWLDEMTGWRHHLHAHPEIALQETQTSDFVAQKLEGWGLEVHRGLAGTGVIGTLRGTQEDGRTIAFRADMDALPMDEDNDFAHRSTHPGAMHACGHDGHTSMLLGAARYLAENRNFAGTIHFIFQPAEEDIGGARLMIEEGLFDKFPVDSVWGMHNHPGMPEGQMGVIAGPAMAAADSFELTIQGKGGHASTPTEVIDPVMIGAQIVAALPGHIMRRVGVFDQVVTTITKFHAGTVMNVVPDTASLTGDVRTFRPETRDLVEAEIGNLADHIARMNGGSASYHFERGYPPTVNSEAESDIAAEVASEVFGDANVTRDLDPKMGGEDFSFMLEKKPGCYVWIGQKRGPDEKMYHHPSYDFNDAILPAGASYWVALADRLLK